MPRASKSRRAPGSTSGARELLHLAQVRKVLGLGCLLLFTTGYPALYALARWKHLIVHQKAHTYDAHGHTVPSRHDVVAGDGKLASPNGLVAAIFTPLRLLETGAWHVLEPLGQPDGLP